MAQINGTRGDDLITGTSADDDISGGNGNDTIQGLLGDDTIDGGKDDDSIDGGDGNDEIDGVSGNDTIDGGNGNDTINAGSGEDSVDGGAGDDDIDGGSGDDTINAGSGNDTIDGGSGHDAIDAGAGNDLIDGASGHDTMAGGAGDDTLVGGSGLDVAVFSGEIADFLFSTTSANDIIVDDQNTGDGDEGTDTLNDEIEILQFDDYTLDLTSQANNAPVAQVSDQTIDEDSVLGFGLTLVDFDGDNVAAPTLSVTSTNAMNATVPVSISVIGGPTPGVTGLGSATDFSIEFNPGDGYQYLAAGESVTETVTVTSTDEFGATFVQTFDIVITGVNDDPDANNVTADAGEDGPAVAISADFTDVDASDSHSFSVNTTGTLGSVTNNGDGTFSYDPNGQFEALAAGETATDTFTYTVDDGNGGTDTATVTVTITGVNDAPVAGAAADTFNEVNGENIVIDLRDYVTEVDGTDTLTFTNIGLSRGGTVIPFTVIGDGLISIDPDGLFLDTGESLTTAFSFTVTDDSGAVNNFDTGELTVTINGLDEPTAGNSAPTAHAVTLTGLDEADGTVGIAFSELATDPDIGDVLTITSMTWVDAGGVTHNVIFTGEISTGEGDVLIDLTQFGLEEGDLETIAISFTVEDEAGLVSTNVISLEIAGDTPGAGNTAPTANSLPGQFSEIQDIIVDDPGVTTLEIDLSGLVFDPDTGDTLTITVDGFVLGFDEETGAPITADYQFDAVTGIVTITFADLNLGDGESVLGSLQYTVSDGTDTASGEVVYNYVNPVDPTGPTSVTLDFEPFSNDGTAAIEIYEYDGFVFQGSAVVYETDELAGGDGRDETIYAPIINGQTTPGGDNVLVGTYSTIDIPLLDELGAPVLDERGEQVYETVVDEVFGFTSEGFTFGVGDTGLIYGQLPAGSDPALPAVLPDGIGAAFNLDGVSLNVVGNDNVTVTITVYTIDIVEGEPVSGFPTYNNFYYELVELDSFEFVINASDPAEVIDFNAAGFADDAPGADDITHLDGIYAVTITTDDGSVVVIDDLLVTI